MKNIMDNLRYAFLNLSKSILHTSKIISKTFGQLFKHENEHLVNPINFTKYKCDKCGSMLLLCKNEPNAIYYQCINCGKIHKANKGKILGRFKQ